jgi:hypothetical protein
VLAMWLGRSATGADLSFAGLGRIEARTSLSAADPGPARSIGNVVVDGAPWAHDVSIPMTAGVAVGLWRGGSPALKTSMMRMAEPQQRQLLAARRESVVRWMQGAARALEGIPTSVKDEDAIAGWAGLPAQPSNLVMS